MGMVGYLYSISPDLYAKANEDPDNASELFFNSIEDNDLSQGFVNLEQSWQCMHFLLSGNAGYVDESRPITKAVLGGKDLDDLRFLAPTEVNKIARALKETDPNALAASLTPADFQKAQLYQYDSHDHESECAILIELYGDLVSFYGEAATKGNAVVGHIS